MSQKDAKIGIVGGAGPYAGLDLAQKILHQTVANSDQDYLPTLLISTPGLIEDRTDFLLGETEKNPLQALYRWFKRCALCKRNVLVLACRSHLRQSTLEQLSKTCIYSTARVAGFRMGSGLV